MFLFAVTVKVALLLPFTRADLYFVSPLQNSSACPDTGEHCFPLNYYVNGGYLTSNNVFKFLPGNHSIERPLSLSGLHNVTLESVFPESHPIIKTDYAISCYRNKVIPAGGPNLAVPQCSTLYFHHCSNITLKGIQVKTTISWKIPGDELWKIRLNLIAVDVNFNECEHLLLKGIRAKRGLYISSSKNISVTQCQFGDFELREPVCKNITTESHFGVYLYNTFSTLLRNVSVNNVKYYGVYLQETTNTSIEGLVSVNNFYGAALMLDLARSTQILNSVLTVCSGAWATLQITTSLDTRIEGGNTGTSFSSILAVNNINLYFVSVVISVNSRDMAKSVVVDISTCTNVTFLNSHFNDTASIDYLFRDVVSLPSVISVYFSLNVKFHNCIFARNEMSVLHARASDIVLSGQNKFLNNSAAAGAAIIISKESHLILSKNSHSEFIGNRAVSSGGAIYIVSSEEQIECFLHVYGDRFHPQMIFRDNWAENAGDVLYGGHLQVGYNGIHDNCLQNFWNASDISEQKSLSVISSEPSRACLCNEENLPDCFKIHSQPQALYPGETLGISVVIVGQAFGTVTGSVFAQFIQPSSNDHAPAFLNNQRIQVAGKDGCKQFNFTILKAAENGSSEAILALTPQFSRISHYISNNSSVLNMSIAKYNKWADMEEIKSPFPKDILEFPVYVNVTLLPCLIGFELKGHPHAKCECHPLLDRLDNVECDIIKRSIARSGLVWIGIDDEGENMSDTLMISSYCPLNYCKRERTLLVMEEYDAQCNYDRKGVVCGQCKQNLSLALGSSSCLPCSNRYLVLTLPFILAGVVLVALVKLGNLTIAHGTLNSMVFYVNIIKANEAIFLPAMKLNPLTLFISWTNLDLGIETCFWDGLDAYGKAWLQFVFPLYLWAIAGVIVILSKYSRRVAGLMGSNSVSVLATLFFLSYTKLLRIVIVGLSYTVLEKSSGRRIVWSSDGSLDYLGPKHAILFVACIATLLFFWLPYTLLLFCGQWLYKIKCNLMVKLLGRLTPFLDAHYAPLKGSHRYWFGAQLLIRAAILIILSTIPSDSFSTIIFSISLTAVILTALSSVGFYHNKLISILEMTFFANLSLLSLSVFFTASIGKAATIPSTISISFAFLQFLALVVYHFIERFKLGKTLVSCHKRRHIKRKQFPGTMDENADFFMIDTKMREEEIEEENLTTRDSTCYLLENQDTDRTY